MEVFNEDSPQKPTVSFDNICRTCSQTVLERNHPVDLFGKKMSSLLMQVVVFLSGKKISMEDNFPRKVCQPCFRKVISIAEFKSMTQASLSSQEQTLAAAKVKRLRSCQQVGDSPSSSQKSKKRVAVRYVRTSLSSTDGTTDKTSSQLTSSYLSRLNLPPILNGSFLRFYVSMKRGNQRRRKRKRSKLNHLCRKIS